MDILGISAYGSSGAVLVRDGRVIAASSEEHFTRTPGESGTPRRAVRFCLSEGGITARDLRAIVLHEKPLRRFERVLAGQLSAFPRSSTSFARQIFTWLGERMWLKTRLAAEFGVEAHRIYFAERHAAHAASAFFGSPFESAAILIADAEGEWATTSLASGHGAKIEVLSELHHPHSPALAARAVARWLGFGDIGGEGLLEALAAHGEPRHVEAIAEFMRVGADAHVELDPLAFSSDLAHGLNCGPSWVARFGPARRSTDRLLLSEGNAHHADVAASFQRALEGALLALVYELYRRVPVGHLCISGALARNRTALARIVNEGPFAHVFVPPVCGDLGAALGAALDAHCIFNRNARPPALGDMRVGEALWIEERPAQLPGCAHSTVANEDRCLARMVDALAAGRTVGWVRGRAEFTDRPSSQRVILADPRRVGIAQHMARSVLRCEEFVPLSCALPAERAGDFFTLPERPVDGSILPSVALRVKPGMLTPCVVDRLGSARPLFVDSAVDGLFHDLLVRFEARTGTPFLLCAPFAPRGGLPVRGERDALAFFERSLLDMLLVESRVYERT